MSSRAPSNKAWLTSLIRAALRRAARSLRQRERLHARYAAAQDKADRIHEQRDDASKLARESLAFANAKLTEGEAAGVKLPAKLRAEWRRLINEG